MPTTTADFNCQPINNPKIICQDATTGIYKDIGGDWYLNNGTPLDDFDPNTGAYSEGGDWYTFHGVPLKSYNTTTGSYQEEDGTWYYKNGTPIPESEEKPKGTPAKKPKINMLYIGGGLVAVSIIAFLLLRKK